MENKAIMDAKQSIFKKKDPNKWKKLVQLTIHCSSIKRRNLFFVVVVVINHVTLYKTYTHQVLHKRIHEHGYKMPFTDIQTLNLRTHRRHIMTS